MSELTRFGVSLEKELLDKFDAQIKEQSYETRSKAISDLIKQHVEADIINTDGVLAGAVTFLYSHHNKDLVSKLLEVQHDDHDLIVSMQHIHLDHDTCLEILAVKGQSSNIRSLYYKIQALKGIKLASISVTVVS